MADTHIRMRRTSSSVGDLIEARWDTNEMNRKRIQCLALAVEPGVILTAILITLTAILPTTTAVNHDPCSTSNLTPGGIGSRGNITSPNYPASLPSKSPSEHNCRMHITACVECKIHVTYDEFTAPPCHTSEIPIGSCVPKCDHLMLFEPDYPEDTTQYVFGDSTLNTYTTGSNRLTLIVCHAISNDKAMRRFRLGYEIQEKKRTIRGQVGEVGFFTSPNFPHGYSLHDEVFTFLLENKDPNGLVRLGFDDWNLSPNSRLTVYFHNATHPDGYLTRQGRGERPFVLSSGPSLFIKFETGKDMYAIPYIGFKASYEFVAEPYWPDKPYTVHDEYFYSRYGGEFSFNTQRCWPGDRVDCIWVVTKYNDHNHDQVALDVQSFYIVPGLDFLEVRSGNSSDGLLLGQYEHSNLTGVQFVSEHGFYLRLRATCSNTRRFHAVFTSFTNATSEGCTYYYHFKCGNNRCIAKSLICDGIDHCNDGSDEIGCTTPNPSTRKECITTYVCRNGMGWYCLTDRCNGHNDCEDGTDEVNCWNTVAPGTDVPYLESYYKLGTYIPVGLVVVLLAVIACIVISCCARRKRNLLRRRQQAGQAGRGLPSISASLPGRGRRMRSASETHLNINVEIQHYPDSPPPYEEAISQSQSTYSGIHNMAFSLSDSSDHLMTPPPPYSPRDENPYPPPIPPPRSLYLPSPTGGVIIGMPPNGQYSPSDAVVRPQVPLVGAADVAGGVDLAQVHGGTGTGRRSRDTGRRRQRHSRQGMVGNRPSSGVTTNDHQVGVQRSGGGAAENMSTQWSGGVGTVGRQERDRPNNRRGSDGKPDGSPPRPPPPPPRRRSSGTSSPIQTFVQNLISRAARQTSAAPPTQPPPPTLPLNATSRSRRAAPPAPAPQTLPLQPPPGRSTDTSAREFPQEDSPSSDSGSSRQRTKEDVPVLTGMDLLETVQEAPPSIQKPDAPDNDKLIHSPSSDGDNQSGNGNKDPTQEDKGISRNSRGSATTEMDVVAAVVTGTCDNTGEAARNALSPQEAELRDADPDKALTLEGTDDSMTFV